MESLSEKEHAFWHGYHTMQAKEASVPSASGDTSPGYAARKDAWPEASTKFQRYNPPVFQRSQLRIIA